MSGSYSEVVAKAKNRWASYAILALGVGTLISEAVNYSINVQGTILFAAFVGAGIASEMMLLLGGVSE